MWRLHQNPGLCGVARNIVRMLFTKHIFFLFAFHKHRLTSYLWVHTLFLQHMLLQSFIGRPGNFLLKGKWSVHPQMWSLSTFNLPRMRDVKPKLKKRNRKVRTKCALHLIDKTNAHFEEGKWQLYLTFPELHLIILQKIRWVVSDLFGSCLE